MSYERPLPFHLFLINYELHFSSCCDSADKINSYLPISNMPRPLMNINQLMTGNIQIQSTVEQVHNNIKAWECNFPFWQIMTYRRTYTNRPQPTNKRTKTHGHQGPLPFFIIAHQNCLR